MPLTPADVHNVAFKKPSIGKRGYDEDEVDAFLDVVEAELSRLIEENSELTTRVSEFEAGGTPAPRLDKVAPAAEVPMPVGNGHSAAARLLGLAQETADRLTTEAQAESDKLVADAKSHSEAVVTDATTRAEALVSEATTRAEAAERESQNKAAALDADAKSKYDEVIGRLAGERAGLEKKIDDLRTYEREYRGRLKSWISDQLAQLDGESTREQQPAAAAGPAQ